MKFMVGTALQAGASALWLKSEGVLGRAKRLLRRRAAPGSSAEPQAQAES